MPALIISQGKQIKFHKYTMRRIFMMPLNRQLRGREALVGGCSRLWALQRKQCVSKMKGTTAVVRQRIGESQTDVYTISNEHNDEAPLLKLPKEQELNKIKSSIAWASNLLVAYFTPKGYPHSVSDAQGYAIFAKGQMASLILSTAGGVLSMQALLVAVSMSASVAPTNDVAASAAFTIPLAATLNWVLKDGLGQLGGVVFASFVSNQFDADPKKWRFIATVAMECASFIELLTPLAPSYFLLLASTANIGKNISFLAASASRAAIHKSFAVQENLADVTAKTGSQSIVASVLGTSTGISIAALLQSSGLNSAEQYQCTVLAFCLLSIGSMSTHYAALRKVTITTLSLQRLEYLLSKQFLPMIHQVAAFPVKSSAAPESNPYSTSNESSSEFLSREEDAVTVGIDKEAILLSPQELRSIENAIFVPQANCFGSKGQSPSLHIGSDLSTCVPSSYAWQALESIHQDVEYIVNIINPTQTSRKRGTPEVHLLYKENADEADVLQGLIVAFTVRILVRRPDTLLDNLQLIEEAHRIVRYEAAPFVTSDGVFALPASRIVQLLLSGRRIEHKISDGSFVREATARPTDGLDQSSNARAHNWNVSMSLLEPRYARIAADLTK